MRIGQQFAGLTLLAFVLATNIYAFAFANVPTIGPVTTYEDELVRCHLNGEDRPVQSRLFFNYTDMDWRQMFERARPKCGMCAVAMREHFNQLRVCARAHFYGAEGLVKMRDSGQLYAQERNDMMLVIASGCLHCTQGRFLSTSKGPLKISLVKYHPRGSFFTSCSAEHQPISTVSLDLKPYGTPATSNAVIPFVVAAIFYERRCWGLFSPDAFEMKHKSNFLRIENIHCGHSEGVSREIPLDDIDTKAYRDRAVEFVFLRPINLNAGVEDKDPNMIIEQWGMDEEKKEKLEEELREEAKFSPDIDCARVLQNDIEYITERTQNRFQYNEEGDQIDVDCRSIMMRHNNFEVNLTQEELQFPLAFARTVFRDYKLLENELAATYSPNNSYCYAIDRKSPQLFHRRMSALAKCLTQAGGHVYLLPADMEYRMDSSGHYMIISALECVKILFREHHWEYVVLLQNHDIQAKTNREMVQIFKWYNGTNDIQYTVQGSQHVDFADNIWTLEHLRLYKNATLNDQRELLKNKGQFEVSLSRAFVNWMLNTALSVDGMLDQLNTYRYANDEYFFGTLAATDFLKAPGGFTNKCYKELALAPGFTRFTIWTHFFADRCKGGIIRHSICIMSLEHLVPYFKDTPFMFINKMIPKEDAEAIQCWHEEMYNRTHHEVGTGRISKYRDYYEQMPQVRFNRDKQRLGANFKLDKFDCCYKAEYLNMIRHGQEWIWGCTKGSAPEKQQLAHADEKGQMKSPKEEVQGKNVGNGSTTKKEDWTTMTTKKN